MIRLYGIPVAIDDARGLVATLLNDNQPHRRAAATTIARGIDRGAGLVALSPDERTEVLAALEDCPDGLAELGGVLANDAAHRHGLE